MPRWVKWSIIAGALVSSICLLGIGAAIILPAISGYVTRAKISEVTSNLDALKSATLVYCRQQSAMPHNAGPVPSSPSEETQKADFAADAVFTSLGFKPDAVRFSYQIRKAPEPSNEIRLQGIGDLDGDGKTSLYEYSCTATPECRCSEAFYIENGNE